MARIDQERVKLAAEIQENLFPHTIGKGQVRPGTQFLGNTASNAQARLISFIKSKDETAVLELSNAKLRVWVDDALVTRASVTSTVGNGAMTIASATITVTIATPAVVTWTAHGFSAGQAVTFKTTGALPTGITAGTVYYVISAGLAADTFRFSTTAGGAAVNTSGSQSGTHTGDADWITTSSKLGTCTLTGGEMVMYSLYSGGTATADQQVTTSSANTEHALRIVVTSGPVTFMIGTSQGGFDLIEQSTLGKGTHSLAFTPTGASYWIRFTTTAKRKIKIDSCTVEASGVVEFTAPWATSELREIRTDQSADIVYLAHNNWQQRTIERRGDASWSLVVYETEDGPFSTEPTSDVRFSVTAFYGNGTLTSDKNFFTSDHVGCLFRLFHEGQAVQTQLSSDNQFSDPIKVTGIGADRIFNYTTVGTWVGTLSHQRSYTGVDEGFNDYTTGTGNIASTTFTDTSGANVDVWYRYGFRGGNYTSGSITISLQMFGGGGYGICRVTGYTSATSVSIEILDTFKGGPPIFSSGAFSTALWQEGEWSEVNGWPTAVSFFDGRLGWARYDRFWLSESDDYTAFNLETEGDAGSIQRSIATGGAVNQTQWMMPLQRLIFGTDGSEASARASSFDQPLTPTGVTLKDASTQGVAAVSPAKLDGRGVFVQRSGTQVYEILYSLERQDYVSTSLTKFNDEIGLGGLLELAVQRQPQSYIWAVRADGQCPILLYDPQEQVAGWLRYIGAPSLAGVAVVESVCVLPDDGQDAVYLSVKRTINGSTVRFIEKLRKHSEATGGLVAGVADATVLNAMADAATLTAGPVSSVTLAHLASETGLVGWGTLVSTGVAGPLTGLSANGSGVIELGASYTNVWVGLKYNWRYKSSKMAYAAQGGTALLQRKRVGPVGLLAADIMYGAIQFGPDFDTMDPLPLTKDGTDVSQTTVYAEWDQPEFPFRGGWTTDSRLCMKGSAPYPATLLGLVVGVETHG